MSYTRFDYSSLQLSEGVAKVFSTKQLPYHYALLNTGEIAFWGDGQSRLDSYQQQITHISPYGEGYTVILKHGTVTGKPIVTTGVDFGDSVKSITNGGYAISVVKNDDTVVTIGQSATDVDASVRFVKVVSDSKGGFAGIDFDGKVHVWGRTNLTNEVFHSRAVDVFGSAVGFAVLQEHGEPYNDPIPFWNSGFRR
ncbi:hypothetical protein [Algicola sagamiensis]|uniref:hypothetical protein n=1 Tax=Algicola sagamiensis TaxID=163869 RepID=UPI0012F88EB3|nr:hypothetical protein [Algicola sagamiensis]